MARIVKNLAFTVPPAMAEEFERLALEEHSSKSELFRRIFRFYQASRKTARQDSNDDEARFDVWVEKIIFDAIEEKKTQPLDAAALSEVDDALLLYGAQQATSVGISTEEQVNDIIHEERQKRRHAARRT